MRSPCNFDNGVRNTAIGALAAPAIWRDRNRFSRAPAASAVSLVWLISLVAALGLLILAQPRPALAQGVELVRVNVATVGKGYRTSKLLGNKVLNDKNENIGTISDLIIGQDHNLFAVLQVGGFLGIGSRLVAVPYDTLQIDDSGGKIVLPGASRDALEKLAEFKYLG
jgi:sporulation protein YlmC with PRC-barrel domain